MHVSLLHPSATVKSGVLVQAFRKNVLPTSSVPKQSTSSENPVASRGFISGRYVLDYLYKDASQHTNVCLCLHAVNCAMAS